MSVLIAGAGIGGLALGLSLHQLGIPFQIFEAVDDLKPLGVGINLQPHAVRELYELGLKDDLDRIGLRTQGVAYFSAQGGEIWSEPRGEKAGYHWPQYSIHRGDLQMLLHRTLAERAGAKSVRMGAALSGWTDDGKHIQLELVHRGSGKELDPVNGRVLVAADGINSTARARLYPGEGPAHWSGVIMWRGTTIGQRFLGGRTMAMAGTRACKFVCYPIKDLEGGKCLINWIADQEYPADFDWAQQDWNRPGRREDIAPAYADWSFDWLDIPKVIQEATGIWEYPMVDRNPLGKWSYGRMTLLGDAAHAMYPIGSNGASQCILDARVLARELRDIGVGASALLSYETARREVVNKVILANRGDGPDKVLDTVAQKAPNGFEHINEIMNSAELERQASKYKTIAGMDVNTLNSQGPLIPM